MDFLEPDSKCVSSNQVNTVSPQIVQPPFATLAILRRTNADAPNTAVSPPIVRSPAAVATDRCISKVATRTRRPEMYIWAITYSCNRERAGVILLSRCTYIFTYILVSSMYTCTYITLLNAYAVQNHFSTHFCYVYRDSHSFLSHSNPATTASRRILTSV